MGDSELKKQTGMIDLALRAARKRQSSQTGFVHDRDAIPIYENFCFAFALFRQRTAEAVGEGKSLIEKLLSFQTEEGNFPIYLHEYPKCFDFNQALKVAPILIYLLRLFPSVIGEIKEKVEASLRACLQKEPEKLFWKNRYNACLNKNLLEIDCSRFSAHQWTEWVITSQLIGVDHSSICYDGDLQVFLGGDERQEGGEPKPSPIEWLFSDGQFSPRLLQDHADQILCAPLFPATFQKVLSMNSNFRFLWKGEKIHTLSLSAKSPYKVSEMKRKITIPLLEEIEIGRGDLFEASLYTDISNETEVLIGGKKGTFFKLGDVVTIRTPSLSIHITWELTKGTGDFSGHLFRSNRPSQVVKGTESYDWQIALRTLRRSPVAEITIHYEIIKQ